MTAENKPFYRYPYILVYSSEYGDIQTHKDDHPVGVLLPTFAHHIVTLLYAF